MLPKKVREKIAYIIIRKMINIYLKLKVIFFQISIFLVSQIQHQGSIQQLLKNCCYASLPSCIRPLVLSHAYIFFFSRIGF